MSMVGAQQPAAGWGKARQTVKRNSIMFNLLKRNSKASAAEAAPRKIGWLSFLSSKPASEAATRILAAYIMKVASEAWRIGSPPTTHQNRRSRGGEGSRKALDQPAARPMPTRGLDAAGR